jgi:glycosyltransferase involved in cell wall biosynthesis
LLRSFEQVRTVHPEAQLVLIGKAGPGWDTISARHEALIDSDAVRVVGHLPDAEAAALVRGAKVFVYPSRYEGFGIPPLEAMAAGTPVVAAKAASLPEALGDHARWVDPDDIDGMAAAISDHFDGSPDPAAIESARSWSVDFSWGASAASTIGVFTEAIAEVKS